jgi:hypothetical protein
VQLTVRIEEQIAPTKEGKLVRAVVRSRHDADMRAGGIAAAGGG